MQIENVSISAIKPYSKNAKKHPKEQVEKIMRSIERFGWAQPLVVDKENVLIIGHGRLEAAKKLKMDTVPVLRMENLSDDEVNALRLADNKLNESEWDMELVDLELGEMSDELKQLTGFEPMEVLEAQEDDFDTTPPEEPKTKLGDLYQLGEHRLLCGDATKIEDVERLMAGEKANMVFTDPPYGVKRDKGFEGFGGFGKPIARKRFENDNWDSERPSKGCFDLMLSMGSQVIIFGGNFFADLLPRSTHWIVWDKKQTMPTFGDCELAWTNLDRKSVKKYEVVYNGLIGKEKERFHPTQKPIKLFVPILEDYSETGQSILDLFGGSGSTLIACEQTGRKCRMMELDPRYCDVIVARWEKLTGKKAELIN